MYGDVWLWAGNFRKSDKNIGIHWTQIAIKLKSLLDDTQYWIRKKTYAPEEIAIRLKHQIVTIHCFPNGNGRHSRLLADIVMDCIFGKKRFSLGTDFQRDKVKTFENHTFRH
jgi:Fic-DOC domain mobile mystery protein B